MPDLGLTPEAPKDIIWSAPLVPVALALTAGILANRLGVFPIYACLGLTLLAIIAWASALSRLAPNRCLPFLWLALAGLGGAYLHWYIHAVPADDIRFLATSGGVPIRVRGELASEPI